MFYGGTVNVFDDIPSEKVQAIMMLAAVSAATAVKNAEEPNVSEAAAPPLSRASSLHSTSNHAVHPPKLPTPTTKVVPPLCKSQSDLPIARRNSFQRFLEKRRDSRLVSKAPYPDVTKEGNEQTSGETSKDRTAFSPVTPLEEDYASSANLAAAAPRIQRHLTQAPAFSRRGPIKEPHKPAL